MRDHRKFDEVLLNYVYAGVRVYTKILVFQFQKTWDEEDGGHDGQDEL